tara:strand:- start:323 stop:643 length:321 start_codon:yes stop_codon:yes gene_type:complete
MQIPDGLIFGFVDNFILLIGAYTGINIEYRLHKFSNQSKSFRNFQSFLKRRSKGTLGGLTGAGISHAFSNGLGAFLDPSMTHMVFGIVIGTLIPILFIPLIEIIKK